MSRIEEAMTKAREQASLLDGQEPLPKMTSLKQESPGLLPGIPCQTQVQEGDSPIVDITSRRLVAANEYNQPITEEYRKLKAIIVQLVNKNPSKNMLLVTSSIGGEGKSLTALNLAISLAQEHGKRVLLVDADLRKPSIARYLGLSTKRGLTECLKDNADLDEVLVETGLGNLSCLPAGASQDNPVELFSSPKMKALLSQIKDRFSSGYIVIDSSPVLPFAEARILDTLTDSTIYVVKEGGTSLKNIEEGLSTLSEATVVGLVYNKATAASLSGGYHYYYYDYDYKRRDDSASLKEHNRITEFLLRFRKSMLN